MKIISLKENLQKSIGIALKAVPSRSTMPILNYILFTADHGDISITANDTEFGLITAVDGETLEPGIVAIEARTLSEIVKRLPNDEITITTEPLGNEKNNGHVVTITCKKSKFQINGIAGDDFPRLPQSDEEDRIIMPQYKLKEMIDSTVFATLGNEFNPMMAGECMEIRDGSLTTTALDGHRIAIRRADGTDTDNRKIIIPAKAMAEVSKITTTDEYQDVTICFFKNHISFEFGGTYATSRLIDGEYFNVDKLLDNEYTTKVTVYRKELTECIRRAMLLTGADRKTPIVTKIADGVIDISIRGAEGSFSEQVDCEQEGGDIQLGFDPMLLCDAVEAAGEDAVNLYFAGEKRPCVIKDDEETYTYLVLPVNME